MYSYEVIIYFSGGNGKFEASSDETLKEIKDRYQEILDKEKTFSVTNDKNSVIYNCNNIICIEIKPIDNV